MSDLIPIYMLPLPSHAKQELSQSINNIVVQLEKHLPKYGYRLTEIKNEAALIVGHAGTPDEHTVVDVAHIHGLNPTAQGGDGWMWAINARVIETMRHARAITTPSAWVDELVRRDMGVATDVIGWGIDGDEWQPSDINGNYVLWNKTRSDSVCNPDPLVKLAAICPQQLFLTTFLDKEKSNEQAASMVTPNIRAIGRVPYETMKQYIRKASVYLATTRETFGLSTIESMASGVPILGYNWAGTADIVRHGIDGFLCEPHDIEGLKRGLEFCIKHRAVLGANARKRALSYTWDDTARRFAEVYDRVLAPHTGVKVSVVIPHYKYGKYVGKAIESVLEQKTDFKFELIVVDDGSGCQDGWCDIQDYQNAYFMNRESYPSNPDFWIHQKENSGVAHTRNYGIERAQGQYIMCLDADDMLGDVTMLQTLADALDADRGLGIAYTGLRVMTESGEISPNVSAFPPEWDFEAQMNRANTIPTCNLMRKEAWRRAGGYRKEMTPAEDANLWLRIGALGYRARKVTQEGSFIYRLHNNSLSTDVRTGKAQEPNWCAFPFVSDGRHPFASQAKPAQWSHAVRNYDKPVVSVIIPVGKGHENILYRALDSVEYQTLREWEVIVVQNNHTGQPLPLIGYEWVKQVVCDIPNAAAARNTGIQSAHAPLVTFLDADDYFLPTFLEKMVREYKRSQGRYIYCDWISVNKDGVEEPHITPEFDAQQMFRSKSMHSINVVMRRKDALAYPFDETMDSWEDSDMFMNLVAHGVCGKRLNEALIVYDYRTGTLREKGETKKQKLIDLLYDRYKEFIEGTKEVMCSAGCGGVVQGMSGALTPDQQAAALSTSGEMVLIEYLGAVAGHSVKGNVTGQTYGYRQRGEIFNIWKEDALADPERFLPVMAVENEMQETPMPSEPELV